LGLTRTTSKLGFTSGAAFDAGGFASDAVCVEPAPAAAFAVDAGGCDAGVGDAEDCAAGA
jgi:hypothetical protein